ncbi:NUDIX domain-containing protein [Planctomonas sp. JC2975]|uniref:NUDIX domain-containing protein n=1 Tax=Planctomonas sp. JC2975 TaxID=2729626 RepID=UPI001476396A|nr:NUDIX domain-containing protein [Planctomonas sp. JC2975]NNC10378.1 NUDIX domain-containing protein [Planctomonas sp. JC2975]
MVLERRPLGSGDGWVNGPDGRRFWGTFGAAGLLVTLPDAGVLLQHRAEWSHFGGTWGLPGGARHKGESAQQGAIREASEEAGVPSASVRPRFLSLLDLGWWSYSTVVAATSEFFEPVIGDAESIEVCWVPVDEVASLPLHPGFAERWPQLRDDLGRDPVVIVDAANVVGSRPDGWWRDRAGAAARLVHRLATLDQVGWPADALGLPHHAWWPSVVVVLEGEAKRMPDSEHPNSLTIVRAETDGDSAIVEQVRSLSRPDQAIVVTADRGLADRVTALGASTASPGGLLRAFDALA